MSGPVVKAVMDAAKPAPKKSTTGAAVKGQGESTAGSSGGSGDSKNVDEHPLNINHFVVVRYRDDSPRLAKILGIGSRPATANLQQYYVHYLDFNRRMDEWIKVDRIIVMPSGANSLGKERTEAEELIHKQKHQQAAGSHAAEGASGGGGGNGFASSTGSPLGLRATDSADTLEPVAPIQVREKALRRDNIPMTGPPLKRSYSNMSAISLVSMRSDRSSRTSRNGDDDDDDDGDGEEQDDDEEGDGYDEMGEDGMPVGYPEDDYDDADDLSRGTNDPQRGGIPSARGNLLASPSGGRKRANEYAGTDGSFLSLEALNRSMIDNRNHMLSLVDSTGLGGSSGRSDMITNIEELDHDEHEGLDEDLLREHEELTKIKNFNNVMLGKHIMECWYFSPFPREYWAEAPVDCIYFCEFTLRFFSHKEELVRYQNKMPKSLPRHPPGNEIYRDSKLSMFEVDGAVEKAYCQNLSYFAKLFLDHKTLFEDVDVFLYYVLCTYDERGFHPVGYFSKNKFSDAGYNLACILTFPSAQRQGFGRFLISFSYELSKKEAKVGSPEKPLSDLGNLSYRSYWANVILNVIKEHDSKQISVMEICRATSIVAGDVILTLDMLELVYSVASADSTDGKGNPNYIIICTPSVIDDLLKRYPASGLLVDAEKLHWAPLYITDPKRDKWTIAGKLRANEQ